MSKLYTPGPLRFEDSYKPSGFRVAMSNVIVDENDQVIAETYQIDGRGRPLSAQANGRRIVAAWNACLGISTKSLEAGVAMEEVRSKSCCGEHGGNL